MMVYPHISFSLPQVSQLKISCQEISRDAPILCPPCSPDFKWLDIYLGGHLKWMYSSPTDHVEILWILTVGGFSHNMQQANFHYLHKEIMPCTFNTLRYTGCSRRNVPDFWRVFLMLKYADITQNTHVQGWTVTELMARKIWNFDRCYTLVDYQIHIKNGRNMWFL
jgi:hypothetical protein